MFTGKYNIPLGDTCGAGLGKYDLRKERPPGRVGSGSREARIAQLTHCNSGLWLLFPLCDKRLVVPFVLEATR